MKAVSGKRLCKILEEKGWNSIRIHGSHHIFGKVGTTDRISVPAHGNKPLKVGSLKHFMKIEGAIKKNSFLSQFEHEKMKHA